MRTAARRLHPVGFVAPMLPTFSKIVLDGPAWVHEVKHDG
jgi:hypothetical protein